MAKETTIVRYAADFSSYEKSIKDAQRTFDSFARGLGLNVGKLTAVGATIGAVSGALKVAKDAFFKNELQLDEWGRTVKSAESLYSGFLNALNTGNISGYLQNMNNIVNAARAAYDAMDALGTFNAFNQINQAKAQTNLTNAIADFREGTGSKDAVRLAADALKNELQQRQKYEQEAYDAAVSNLAAQRGVSASDLMKAMSGSYGNYQTLKNVKPTGSKTVFQSNGQFGGTTSYNVAVPANEAERLGEALRQLNDTELQSLQALGAAAQRTANEIANIDKLVARVLRGNTGGTGSSGGKGGATDEEAYVPAIGSIDEMRAKVKDLQDEFNKTADQSIRGQLLVAIDEAQKKLDFISGKGLTPVSRYSDTLSDKLGIGFDTYKELKEIEGAELDDNDKATDTTIQAIKENMNNVRDITSSVSGILNGIQNMGIEIPEEISRAFGILQTMSSVLTAILTITTLIKGEQEIQTGASIFKAIFPFAACGVVRAAGGYEVPGNYGYDAVPALLSSGELVLNKSQQGVLAASLQDSAAGRGQNLLAKVKGTDLIVMLDRTGRMTGKGELAFWKD